MNRRGFLAAVSGAAAAFALDPERALWVPGRKKIFIPKPRVLPIVSVSQLSIEMAPGVWKAIGSLKELRSESRQHWGAARDGYVSLLGRQQEFRIEHPAWEPLDFRATPTEFSVGADGTGELTLVLPMQRLSQREYHPEDWEE